jgi:beta-lactamase class A
VQDVDPDIHLSVYFRNLNNGPWFGINEKEDFSPASLMKLPILIMYLKWSEEDPSILKKTVKLEKNPNSLPQMIQPIQQGEIGKEYSIEELLSMLIVYSDNSVLGALLSQIPEAIYNKVFTDL